MSENGRMIIRGAERNTELYPFEASVIRFVYRHARRVRGATPRQARRIVRRFLRDVDYARTATPRARSHGR